MNSLKARGDSPAPNWEETLQIKTTTTTGDHPKQQAARRRVHGSSPKVRPSRLEIGPHDRRQVPPQHWLRQVPRLRQVPPQSYTVGSRHRRPEDPPQATPPPDRRKAKRGRMPAVLDRRQYLTPAFSLLVAVATVLSLATTPVAAQSRSSADFVPVTDAMLQDPAPADWLMRRRTLDGWGYSPLDQITRANVDELRLVWSRALGPGSQQGTPLAYDGVLYMPNPSDPHSGDRCHDRRSQMGVSPPATERPRRASRGPGHHQAEYRHLRQSHHRHDRRRLYPRARRGLGRGRLGDAGPGLHEEPPPCRPPARSSRMAKSSRGAAAGRPAGRTAVSSPPTTREPARSCGGGVRFRGRANRVTRRGVKCHSKSESTSAPGWCRASIRH